MASLTSSFLQTLNTQRSSLTRWLETEKSHIDSICDELSTTAAQESEHIEGLIRRLDEVRVQRGLASASGASGECSSGGVAQQKRDLEEKQSRLEAEVKAMRAKNREGENKLNELLQQQSSFQADAIASQNKKMAIAEMKNTTIDDLTRGLINYKYLGLGFETVGRKGDLLFKFTKLSPAEPNRAFSFILTLQPDNNFAISKCEPELNTKKTDELLQILNTDGDDGWMCFVVGMRKLFKESLEIV